MSGEAFQGAYISAGGTGLSTELQEFLLSDSIQPGSDPSYQLCKTIYCYHPLGAKMADAPIEMAQSQARVITVARGPEEKVVEAFLEEWARLGADDYIFALGSQARTYGISSLAVVVDGKKSDEDLPAEDYHKLDLAFSVFDPLNTAGSLTLNQDPTSVDFQKYRGIIVNGDKYSRARCVVLMHERPMFIKWSSSAFGFSGRSVYQRALYPLKSFVRCMQTDDMVATKAGLLIAKIRQGGSIITNIMSAVTSQKRQLVKEAQTGNVLSIDPDEAIETLNMQNVDGAYGLARMNIIKNIATAASMPARILDNEVLISGFGEGTEDAKMIARYVERVREWLNPAYKFFDDIVMRRAWNPEFYASIQESYPETYRDTPYNQAFLEWKNSFKAKWPSLLIEPESERAQKDDIKLKAAIATVQVLTPFLDPENKVRVVEWFQKALNDTAELFTRDLDLDFDAMAEYQPLQQEGGEEPAEPKPFGRSV